MIPAEAQCPPIAEIERIAAGGEVFPDLALHFDSCAACRIRIDAAREDAAFVGRVRELASPALGPQGAPRIPGYRILGVINSGAQGVVYRAVQESTSRTVAIKAIASGRTATVRQRLRAEREAEIAARLRHPNIVSVFESRTLPDGRIVVVMEFIDGVPLDEWRPKGPTAADRRRELFRGFIDVCGGIHHAHLNGVIHRDLKPENILVTAEGRPVVLDFGIAKAGGIRTTMTGEFAGTPAYASPEQVSGKPDEVDALTDVYSLGVILYRLVCGAMPYALDGSIFDIARTISEVEPVPPRQVDSTISADLEAIILRALSKQKPPRYQSAASLARDVERYIAGDPVEARSGSGWYLLRKAVVMNRSRLTLAAVAFLLLIGSGIAVALSLASAADSSRRAQFEREQARAERTRARAVGELLREAIPASDPRLAALSSSGLGNLYFRLETGAFANDPEYDQALRRLWAGVYTELAGGRSIGLVEYAEVSLRNGLVRLRLQHGAEHPDIAASLHALAGVVLVRNRAPEAQQFCRSALAMRSRLLGDDSSPAADSKVLLAKILLAMGRDAAAVAQADDAIATLRTLPAGETMLPTATMLAVKARAHLRAGQPALAEPLIRDALVRRLGNLPSDDTDLHSSLADAADLIDASPPEAVHVGLPRELLAAWQCKGPALSADIRRDIEKLRIVEQVDPIGRTQALSNLIRLQEALLGPDDLSVVGSLIVQMRSASSDTQLSIRADAALRAAEILSRRFRPDDPSVVVCLDAAASARAYTGRISEAVELQRRTCRINDAIPAAARDPMVVASGHRYLGWYLLLAGNVDEALPICRQAIDEFRAVLGPDHYITTLAESDLAYGLALTGNLDEADRISERALALAQQALSMAESSRAVGGFQLAQMRVVRGYILQARRQSKLAIPLLESAWSAVYNRATPEHPMFRMLVSTLSAAHGDTGDHVQAARWNARLNTSGAAVPAE